MAASSGDSSSSGRVGRVHSAAIQPSVHGNQRTVCTVAVASLTSSIPTERRFTRSISPAERCFSRSCSTQIPCSVSHRSLLSSIEPTKRCSTRSKRWKPRFTVASPSSGVSSSTISGPTQIDESGKVCSGFKGQDPPRDSRHRGGSSRSGRTR